MLSQQAVCGNWWSPYRMWNQRDWGPPPPSVEDRMPVQIWVTCHGYMLANGHACSVQHCSRLLVLPQEHTLCRGKRQRQGAWSCREQRSREGLVPTASHAEAELGTWCWARLTCPPPFLVRMTYRDISAGTHICCVLGLHDGLKQTSLMGKTALPRRPCVGAMKSKAAAIDATCDSHHLPNVFVWGVLVKATSKTRPHETTGGRVIVSIYWWIDRPECWGWDPGFEDARFVPGLWAATAYSENCSFKAPGPGWYVTEHPVAREVLIQASEKSRFTPNCHLLL